MPASFDFGRLQITHDPTQRLDPALARLPKLDAAQVLAQWLDLLKQATGLDLSSPEAFVASIVDILNGISSILDPTTGLIPDWLLPPTNVGRLTAALPNLVVDGGFDAATSGDSEWQNVSGVCTVVADGSYHELITQPIGVAAGQKYRVGAEVGWTGASGSAGSVQLAVVEYLKGDQVGMTVVVSATPSGTQALTEIHGDYTAPSGVDQVALAQVVTEGATAGTIRWDNLDGPSTGLMDMGWTLGLPDLNIQSNQIRDILAGLVVTPINSAVADIKDWFTGLTGKTQNLTGGGLFDATKLSGVVDQVNVAGFGGTANLQDALGSLVDKTVQGAGNMLGSGFGFDDMFDVFSQQQQQITDLNASVAALTAHQTGVVANSGKSVVVNFSDYANASTPPSIFTKVVDTGSGGYISTNNGLLEWVDGGNSNHVMKYLYNVDVLATDYFEVSMVMPRRSESPWFSSPAYQYLLGRANTAGTTYCDAQIGYNTLRAGCMVSGTRTWFGSAVSYSTPAGALVTFRGGTAGGIRFFQILVNGNVRATFIDGGSVSQVGASYRSCGLGMEADTRGSGQTTPGNMAAWSMNDNTPVSVVGTTMRVSRVSTSTVSVSTGDNPLPANVFDNVDYQSADLAWSASTNEVTVNTAGTYLCTGRIELNNVAGMGATDWHLVWYVGGVVKHIGKCVKSVTTNGAGVPATSLDSGFGGDPFVYYLPAGAVIRVGMGTPGRVSIKGESTGAYTNLTVTKIA